MCEGQVGIQFARDGTVAPHYRPHPVAGTYRHAYAWAFAGRWMGKIFSVAVTFILARQLGREEFGLLALALVYLSFIQIFLSTGFASAIIQKADLREEHLHSVFWLNLAFGGLLAAVSILLAPWWSQANNSPPLYKIILVLSATIPVQSLTLVQQAILQRGLDFKTLTIRSTISVVAGGATAIVLVYQGYGVWALVAQHLVTPFVGLITLWTLTAWRPKFIFSFGATRELIGFSANILFGRLAVFATSRADTYLMGLLFTNTAVVGIYRLADSLTNMVLEFGTAALGMVSFSQFSKSQDNPDLLRSEYLSLFRLNGLIVIPSFLLLAGLADPLMEFLGPQWIASAGVLKILCLAGIMQSFASFSGPLLMGVGKPGLYAGLLWTAAFCSNAAIVGAGFLLQDVPDETKPMGIAATRLLLNPLVYFPLLMIPVLRHLRLSFRELGRTILAPTAAGFAAFTAAFLVARVPAVAQLAPFWRVALLGLSGGIPALSLILALDPSARRFVLSRGR